MMMTDFSSLFLSLKITRSYRFIYFHLLEVGIFYSVKLLLFIVLLMHFIPINCYVDQHRAYRITSFVCHSFCLSVSRINAEVF